MHLAGGLRPEAGRDEVSAGASTLPLKKQVGEKGDQYSVHPNTDRPEHCGAGVGEPVRAYGHQRVGVQVVGCWWPSVTPHALTTRVLMTLKLACAA